MSELYKVYYHSRTNKLSSCIGKNIDVVYMVSCMQCNT